MYYKRNYRTQIFLIVNLFILVNSILQLLSMAILFQFSIIAISTTQRNSRTFGYKNSIKYINIYIKKNIIPKVSVHQQL